MRHLMACQDPSDRGRIQIQFGGQHHRATLAAAPSGKHFLLDPITGALRHPDRPRRPVGQRRVPASLGISAQPLVHRRARNPQLLSHMRRRPTSSDTLNDQATSEHVGTGVSVRHEDLLRVNARHIHSVRRSSQFQAATPSTTSQVTTPSRCVSPSPTTSADRSCNAGAASTPEGTQPTATPKSGHGAPLNSAATAAAASIASIVASSSDAGMCADALSNDSTAATRPCARSRSRSPRARTSASTQMDS